MSDVLCASVSMCSVQILLIKIKGIQSIGLWNHKRLQIVINRVESLSDSEIRIRWDFQWFYIQRKN